MHLCCTSRILFAPAVNSLLTQDGELLSLQDAEEEIPVIAAESFDEPMDASDETPAKIEEDKFGSACSSYSDSMCSCVELPANDKTDASDSSTDLSLSNKMNVSDSAELNLPEKAKVAPTPELVLETTHDGMQNNYIVYTQQVVTVHGKTVVLYFAIVCDERYTYLGWFYSLPAISGYGYSFHSDGSYYKGSFDEGKKTNYGEFYYDNGSHYEGFWLDNLKHGTGRFFFNPNLYYSGLWKENKMISCELQHTDSLRNDIQHVYSFITSHNDYIFFKQAQISRCVAMK